MPGRGGWDRGLPPRAGVPLVLTLTGLTVFFNLFGQAVRTQGELDEESVRKVLAYTVAFLPAYLAFLPALVCFNRLKGGGWIALLLVLPLYVGALLAAPALFQNAVYTTADGQILIWPPHHEAQIAVVTPTLGLWGVFTLLEWRASSAVSAVRLRDGAP